MYIYDPKILKPSHREEIYSYIYRLLRRVFVKVFLLENFRNPLAPNLT